MCVCGEEADEVETQVISQPLHPKMASRCRHPALSGGSSVCLSNYLIYLELFPFYEAQHHSDRVTAVHTSHT